MKKKIRGGVIATIGYFLSPLSWWNDLFINLPLAYGFAFLFGLISQKLFLPFLVLGYWITNVAGFILMHYGAKEILSKKEKKYARKEFAKDIIISLIYTAGIVLLIVLGLIKFPTEYFA